MNTKREEKEKLILNTLKFQIFKMLQNFFKASKQYKPLSNQLTEEQLLFKINK